MERQFERHQNCTLNFEDFTTLGDKSADCPMCLRLDPSWHCLGGSHPRQLGATGGGSSAESSKVVIAITKLANVIVPLATMVCNLAIESNNLWTNTQKTDIATDVDEDQKGRLMRHLGVKWPSKMCKHVTLYCMVTNATEEVVMAHIVPKRSKVKLLANIGMTADDVRHVRNCLLLAKGIEEAFDRLQLSFIKSSPLLDRLYVKVWDDSIRDTPIYKGATKTIGDCDGARLKLGEFRTDRYKHNPFRRALSYQAYIAYLKFKHLHDDSSMPEEFGSEEETEYANQRKLMKNAVIAAVEDETLES